MPSLAAKCPWEIMLTARLAQYLGRARNVSTGFDSLSQTMRGAHAALLDGASERAAPPRVCVEQNNRILPAQHLSRFLFDGNNIREAREDAGEPDETSRRGSRSSHQDLHDVNCFVWNPSFVDEEFIAQNRRRLHMLDYSKQAKPSDLLSYTRTRIPGGLPPEAPPRTALTARSPRKQGDPFEVASVEREREEGYGAERQKAKVHASYEEDDTTLRLSKLNADTFPQFLLHKNVEHSKFIAQSSEEVARLIGHKHNFVFPKKRDAIMSDRRDVTAKAVDREGPSDKKNGNRVQSKNYFAELRKVQYEVKDEVAKFQRDQNCAYAVGWFCRLKERYFSMADAPSAAICRLFCEFQKYFYTDTVGYSSFWEVLNCFEEDELRDLNFQFALLRFCGPCGVTPEDVAQTLSQRHVRMLVLSKQQAATEDALRFASPIERNRHRRMQGIETVVQTNAAFNQAMAATTESVVGGLPNMELPTRLTERRELVHKPAPPAPSHKAAATGSFINLPPLGASSARQPRYRLAGDVVTKAYSRRSWIADPPSPHAP